jgi:hypothetical protein
MSDQFKLLIAQSNESNVNSYKRVGRSYSLKKFLNFFGDCLASGDFVTDLQIFTQLSHTIHTAWCWLTGL